MHQPRISPPKNATPELPGPPRAPRWRPAPGCLSGRRLTSAVNSRLNHRMTQSDTATVALARGGDSEAFRALVERHSRAVYRLAVRMTGSPQDAEDVVQETFLKAYKQLGRFESRANFGTWLHRIAVNCSIDLIRARAHRETGHDTPDLEELGAAADAGTRGHVSPERLMLSAEVQARVQAAMDGLSPMERAAFALRHFEGHSIDEISRSLGLKTNATKHSIFRAVRKMRIALEPLV